MSPLGARWLVLCSFSLIVAGCPGDLAPKPEDALALFADEVEAGSLQEACTKLQRVCQANSRGALACMAQQLFCGASVEATCAKLDELCGSVTAVCELAAAHCQAPASDATTDAIADDAGVAPDSGPAFGRCLPDEGGSGGGQPIGKLPSAGPCEHSNDCAADGDLLAEGLIHCADTGRCVSCLSDEHCASGPGNTGKCDDFSRCRRCDGDQDCVTAQRGKRCALSMQRCIPCKMDDDCEKGPQNTGKCRLQYADAELSNSRCNRCEADADCLEAGLGARCDQAQGLCVQCLEHADCAKGEGNTGLCIAGRCEGCLSEDDCREAQIEGSCTY
jgi:hypothetical protein